jgi:Icc-related predicted phosphoesterase
MKIVCVSDLHGFLPQIPDCDLLLLGGDYCPVVKGQNFWFAQVFAPWIEMQSKTKKIIGVAGNHDLLFEKKPELVPQMEWTYLQDSGYEWNGLKFWGSPWQPRFFDWAFNADEDELQQKWSLIPDDTDVLLLHGPPHGFGDFSTHGFEHTGSPSLLKRIEEIQPKLVIAGHIHTGYGVYEIGKTKFLSCAYVNDMYKPVNLPHVVEI